MKIAINTFLVFLLLFLFNSCGSNINGPRINESLGYFPLKVGNQWEFYHAYNDSITTEHKIVEKISIGGKEYFVRDQGGYPDTLRLEDNIIWRRNEGADQKWIDFNKKDGETYQLGDYNISVKTNVEVTTKAGTFKNCVSFFFDIPNAVDDEISYTFAKGVGIVEINGAWVYYLLKDFDVK